MPNSVAARHSMIVARFEGFLDKNCTRPVTLAEICDALLREHGLALEVMANMVRAGLATVHCNRAVEVTRVWITDAGGRALAGRAD